jgi:hypothetical protein
LKHAEAARGQRALHRHPTGELVTAPGSDAEALALAEIDMRRDNELSARADTPATRARRRRRYWRARGLHVDV